MAPFRGARRATLADVAAVARLAVPANREAAHRPPPEQLSAPELALRLLDDLDDGGVLYVAEKEGGVVGFAQVGGPMVGDGGHMVELRQVYVAPEHRECGFGRQLLELALHDLAQRPNPPALRAWAACGSVGAAFLEASGGLPVRQRWRVGPGDLAVKGVLYGWPARAAGPIADTALAK